VTESVASQPNPTSPDGDDIGLPPTPLLIPEKGAAGGARQSLYVAWLSVHKD